MSNRQVPAGDFDTDLTQLLPRLRRPGTNLPGWLFCIQRNEFLSGRVASRRSSS